MNNRPLITIVTICYNAENAIAETIESIVNQTYTNIEHIFIDGASTDNTVNIINSYKKKYQKKGLLFNVISEPDNGIYDAMNKGINVATGEYILFVNVEDSFYESNTLEKVFSSSIKNADVYLGGVQLLEGEYPIKESFPPKNISWKTLSKGIGTIPICHQSFIARISLVSNYSLEYKYASDHEWMIKILKQSKNIVNTNIIISKYLLGGYTEKNLHGVWVDRINIIKKYYSFLDVLRTYLFYFLVMSKKKVIRLFS